MLFTKCNYQLILKNLALHIIGEFLEYSLRTRFSAKLQHVGKKYYWKKTDDSYHKQEIQNNKPIKQTMLLQNYWQKHDWCNLNTEIFIVKNSY